MSTRIGTLQPQARLGHPVRLAGLLAAFLAATLAFAVISVVTDRSDEAPVGVVADTAANTAANTPSELSGGIVGGSVAARVADIQARRAGAMVEAYERAWRSAQLAAFPNSVTGTGPGLVTVAEARSGGFDPGTSTGRRDVTPRVPAANGGIVANGEVCHQCQ